MIDTNAYLLSRFNHHYQEYRHLPLAQIEQMLLDFDVHNEDRPFHSTTDDKAYGNALNQLIMVKSGKPVVTAAQQALFTGQSERIASYKKQLKMQIDLLASEVDQLPDALPFDIGETDPAHFLEYAAPVLEHGVNIRRLDHNISQLLENFNEATAVLLGFTWSMDQQKIK